MYRYLCGMVLWYGYVCFIRKWCWSGCVDVVLICYVNMLSWKVGWFWVFCMDCCDGYFCLEWWGWCMWVFVDFVFGFWMVYFVWFCVYGIWCVVCWGVGLEVFLWVVSVKLFCIVDMWYMIWSGIGVMLVGGCCWILIVLMWDWLNNFVVGLVLCNCDKVFWRRYLRDGV